MTVAVTGAQGQLGGELCRQYGAEAIGLDLPEFDLTDGDAVARRLAALRPTAVINTAAYTLVDRAETERERCRAINVDGVRVLAEACNRLGCPLVQISTDYVFGQGSAQSVPFRETDEPAPRGVYAQTKLEGEREAARSARHLIVRTCGLFGRLGPRSPGNFVETMLRLGAAGKRLRVVDDQRCTPSYVPQVARAVRFLLDSGASGTFHVVNSGSTTWYEFAEASFRLSGMAVAMERITTAEYGALAPRPAYSVLDGGKYHSLPGCPRMSPWEEALAEYLRQR
jgi:dTDP-4-dehydrorhamnose reductase